MSGLGTGLACIALFVSLAWMNVEATRSNERLQLAKLHCVAVAK